MSIYREKLVLISPMLVSLLILIFLDSRISLNENLMRNHTKDYEDIWININSAQLNDIKASIFQVGLNVARVVGPPINESDTLSELVDHYRSISRLTKIVSLHQLSNMLNLSSERRETWTNMNSDELVNETDAVISLAQEAVTHINNKTRETAKTLSNLKTMRKWAEFLGYSTQITVILSKKEEKVNSRPRARKGINRAGSKR